MYRFVASFAVFACGCVLAANTALGQVPNTATTPTGRQLNWGEQMFDKVTHDFGTVARGADVVLRLKITNKYLETIHLSGVHTSCGCISGKLLKDTLKTWEEGIVEVKLNTLQYSGKRNVNLFVTIDQPAYMQITIPIQAYIRTDVVVEPGSAVMGTVSQGEPVEQKLRISYAGSPNWRIADVKSRNPSVVCAVRELSRQSTGVTANIAYELSVRLAPNTAPGDVREQIQLVTNDVNSPQIPVLVEGRVIAEYSVTPPAIALRGMKPGDREEVKIVVRGQKPFVVEKIESNSGSELFQVKLPQKDRYHIIQMLNVIVNAPEKPGTLEEVFTLTLAGEGQASKREVQFKLSGKILGEITPVNESTTPTTVTTAKPATP